MGKNKFIKKIVILLLVVIEVGAIFLAYKAFDNKDKVKTVNLTESNNSMFAIMVEQEDGTFEKNDSWPGEDYTYLENMSGCVDSSGKMIEDSLVYDPKTNTVTLETEYTTQCYLYFKAPAKKFENVRYIKDCIYGNNKNEYNTWIEIQALKDGSNVALNKPLKNNANTYITDGNTSIIDNSISVTYDTVSLGKASDYATGNTMEKVYFNTSGVSVGDQIYFEFKVRAISVISIISFDDNWIDYTVDSEGSGLTVVDGTTKTYYVYGNFTVTQDMINNNEILLEIETHTSSSVTPILLLKNPNYLIDRGDTSCVTVDLQEEQDLDEIKVWHYYKDGRAYKNHTLSISSDNSTWTKIINNQSGVAETSDGISVLP